MSSVLKSSIASDASESNLKLSTLADLRHEIDLIDKDLVSLLEKRAALVFSVGDFKQKNNLPAYDGAREKKIREKVQSFRSSASSLSAAELDRLFTRLVEEFRLFESVHMRKSLQSHPINVSPHINFNKTQKVIFWGFGLMGASLFLALRESLPHWEFYVVDPHIDSSLFNSWKQEHNLTNIAIIEADRMAEGNIFILAAPVESNLNNLTAFKFPAGAVVFDLGSTKRAICDTFSSLGPCKFIFVGGHPLAGRECSGFANADALLYYNKTFCWVKSEKYPLEPAVEATFNWIAAYLGAKSYWLSAEDHDAALTWTSHLPQIISSTVAQCLSGKKFSGSKELFPGVISDLLRISGSPISMWKPIFETNQPGLQQAVTELIVRLQDVHTDLQQPNACEKLFDESNTFYKKFKTGA